MKCNICGFDDALLLISTFLCVNPDCKNYDSAWAEEKGYVVFDIDKNTEKPVTLSEALKGLTTAPSDLTLKTPFWYYPGNGFGYVQNPWIGDSPWFAPEWVTYTYPQITWISDSSWYRMDVSYLYNNSFVDDVFGSPEAPVTITYTIPTTPTT